MRRIIMFNRVTADGYFAGADGNLDWVVPEPELDKGAREDMPRADTVMLGRRTYEMFAAYWPHAVDEDPHAPGRRSEEIRVVAAWLNEAKKVVFSRTLEQASWRNSQLYGELDPRAVLSMKQQPGKDIMLFGSGSIVTQLTQHRLIDEYHFVVGPVLIGSGRSLLGGLPKHAPLRLLEAKAYPNGNVSMRYAPG